MVNGNIRTKRVEKNYPLTAVQVSEGLSAKLKCLTKQ